MHDSVNKMTAITVEDYSSPADLRNERSLTLSKGTTAMHGVEMLSSLKGQAAK
jgi:hypothetical protein